MSKERKTVFEESATLDQLADIIASLVQAIPQKTKADAQLMISCKKLWQEEIKKTLESFTLKGVSLHKLLMKNCSAPEDLSKLEEAQARTLIAFPLPSNGEKCMLCKDEAIHDSHLCRGHAEYALNTQK